MSSQWPVAASIQMSPVPGQTRFRLLPAPQLPVLCHQLDSPASVLLGEEEDTLGLGPRRCSMTAPAPPGSVILLVGHLQVLPPSQEKLLPLSELPFLHLGN